MAMSFARPDPSSPASVADATFNTSRRGFDTAEVRDFLRMIAAELGRLQERERFLERELRTAQTNPDLSSAQLDDAALTRLLGEETARVLSTARESAVEIRAKAEQAAAQMVTEASTEAARIREEAEIEASRRRADAAADAEAELSMAKQQGREMVNEARAYRERVLSELARRRELAREQIEQLMHGRDRLMQSFERARLVAVDVVAELQPLGEPDEYVNLAPTTGPIPVMLPNAPRPAGGRSDEPTDGAETDGDEAAVDEPAVAEVVEPADRGVAETDETGIEPELGPDDEVDPSIVDTEAGEIDTAAAAADPSSDDGDVVVDLFARLRAETAVEPAPAVEESPTDESLAVDEPTPASDEAGDDAARSWFERRDADLTPIIVSSARKLKRVLADEQNEVLERLRTNVPVTELGSLLPEDVEHLDRYSASIADELIDAADCGAAMVGASAKLRTRDAAQAMGAAEAVLSEWLVAPLRERLARCVAEGRGDNAGISKRIRAVYREWKTQHIDEQLDDIVRTAHGAGAFAAVEPGTPVIWRCDPAHQGCADCDDNALGGAVPAGQAFPTGHSFAPAHIGCRCLLLPDGR
jgi:DivIVA domain-containing protein